MPFPVAAPATYVELNVEPLTSAAYAAFGSVIQNPAANVVPSPAAPKPASAALVNQGSAFKYSNISEFQDYYSEAPSKVPARTVFSMFVCAPRALSSASPTSRADDLFQVRILERHPYTSQTFIPLGLGADERDRTRYLVIVAPTLAQQEPLEIFPAPTRMTSRRQADGTTGANLPGNGLPDLNRIKAFWADGSQAVTYAAGTWHAPMVVVGEHPVSFTVVQAANGVSIEDCQEVDIVAPGSDSTPRHSSGSTRAAFPCARSGIAVRVSTSAGHQRL